MTKSKHKQKTCVFCKGTGKVTAMKETRKKCKDCDDRGHSCFGSGFASGLGYEPNPDVHRDSTTQYLFNIL